MLRRFSNLNNLGIYLIIIVLFFGKSIYTSSLAQGTQREHIEEQTRFASQLIALELEASGVLERDEQSVVKRARRERLEKSLSEGDHWVCLMDQEGGILYQSGEKKNHFDLQSPEAFREGLVEVLEKASREGELGTWLGKNSLGFLREEYLFIRSLGKGLFLADINECTSLRGQLRQQYVMQWGLDVLVLLTCVILIANQSFSYRRKVVRLATKDELTGLSNRKFFNSEFADYVKQEGDGRKPSTLFLLDVDCFKQINDGYGHAAGDSALRFIGQRLLSLTKTCGGFAGRWGGDEFIGLLPLPGDQALPVLEQMGREIAASQHAEGFTVTVSIGAAQMTGGEEISEISEKADQALYQSKENGRNQVNLYSREMETEALRQEKKAEGAGAKALVQAQTLVIEKKKEKEGTQSTQGEEGVRPKEGMLLRIRNVVREKLLMSILVGVQWMAPFVAGGGILIALAFLVDAASVDLSALTVAERSRLGTLTPLAQTLKGLGGNTFNFMLPVFAGFMAYAIGGEDAFLSGFVGGYLVIGSNSGFVGSIVAGLVAGLSARELSQFTGRLPRVFRRAAPILVYPVFNLLLVAVLSVGIITPVASWAEAIFSGILSWLVEENPLLAGGFSSMMMAVDMGGIVNKVAYNYGVAGLEKGMTDIMAAVMIGGMVPPLGVFLSLLLFPGKYSSVERERGLATLFMGLSFITEGTLPYVFTDFVRIIPACMAGSMVSGLLSISFGCRLPAPHGGIFVLPVMENPLLYLVALLVGSMLTAGILGVWKKDAEEAF